MGDAGEPLYYHDYLQLDRLLSCQQPESEQLGRDAHDELLFIIVHQAYELWFKQILHELDAVLGIFAGVVADRDMLRAVGHLHRVAEIERLLLHQVDVLETMTPLDFLDFRDLLVPASGFQSVQFRIIENRLGVDPEGRPRIGGGVYTTRFSAEHRHLIERTEGEPTPVRRDRGVARAHTVPHPRRLRLLARVPRRRRAQPAATTAGRSRTDPRLDAERAPSDGSKRSTARPLTSPPPSTPRPTPATTLAIARTSRTGRSRPPCSSTCTATSRWCSSRSACWPR